MASSTSDGSQAAKAKVDEVEANAKVDENEALQLLDRATPAELAAQAKELKRARSSLARRLAREERKAKKPRVIEPPRCPPPVLGVASCSCLQQPCPAHADPKSFKYHHDMSNAFPLVGEDGVTWRRRSVQHPTSCTCTSTTTCDWCLARASAS